MKKNSLCGTYIHLMFMVRYTDPAGIMKSIYLYDNCKVNYNDADQTLLHHIIRLKYQPFLDWSMSLTCLSRQSVEWNVMIQVQI